jgi:hypothetical protein
VSEDQAAPGWDAINLALKPLYGQQEPVHWAPIIHYRLGGSGPLDGISAYRRQNPEPHWHFITYGFSELYAKESNDPATSGFGFELTFRLRTEALEEPPGWVADFLQNLARYVFSSGNIFKPGDYMDLNGPIAIGFETKLRAITLAEDPELPPLDTPHGRLQFLQIIGITLDEKSAIMAWDALRFTQAIQPHLPLWMTELKRASLLETKGVSDRWKLGICEDGSSTAKLFVSAASWHVERTLLRTRRLVITLGANAIRDFKAVLPARLAHKRPLEVVAKGARILFSAAGRCSWQESDEGAISIQLTPTLAQELADLLVPKAGTYRLRKFPRFVIRVIKSEIKNSAGEVVETIG